MNFINTLFESGFEGITFTIGENCNKAITDLLNGQESGDGTKLKERYKDPKTGASIERYHHFSDLIDYLVITIYANEFHRYLQGGRKATPVSFGKNAPSRNTYDAPPKPSSGYKFIKRVSKNSFR